MEKVLNINEIKQLSGDASVPDFNLYQVRQYSHITSNYETITRFHITIGVLSYQRRMDIARERHTTYEDTPSVRCYPVHETTYSSEEIPVNPLSKSINNTTNFMFYDGKWYKVKRFVCYVKKSTERGYLITANEITKENLLGSDMINFRKLLKAMESNR